MKIPIETLHLFPELDHRLITLLRSLSPEDWHRPTRAKLWTVKDIAAHLLDGNLRTLSMSRDGYFGVQPGAINSYQDLVGFLNQLNADWVNAAKRLSPAVITELLAVTGKPFSEHLASLDPFAKALFAVDWAGEKHSANWFHIAREYTEKWHHQQQIREAVGQPGIMERTLYYPVLDTFMQALPHTYRNTAAPTGIVVKITISGESGGHWIIKRQANGWEFIPQWNQTPETEVIIDQDNAWKLLTKGISTPEAQKLAIIYGNTALAQPVLSMVSVMA